MDNVSSPAPHANSTSEQQAAASASDVDWLFAFTSQGFFPAVVFSGGLVNVVAGCVVVALVLDDSRLREQARFVLLVGVLLGDIVFTVPALVLYGMAKWKFLITSIAVSVNVVIVRTALFVGVLCIAAMSAELYVAVCLPLRHGRLCSPRAACAYVACSLAMGAAPALVRFALEIFSSTSQGSTLALVAVFSNSMQGGGSASSGNASARGTPLLNGSLALAPGLTSNAAELRAISMALDVMKQAPAALILAIAYLCVIGSYVLVSKACRRASQRAKVMMGGVGTSLAGKHGSGPAAVALPGGAPMICDGTGGKQGPPPQSQDAPEHVKNTHRARNTIAIHMLQLTMYLSALYYPYMHGFIDATVSSLKWRLWFREIVFIFCFVIPRALSPIVHGARSGELWRRWSKRVGIRG